MYINYSRGCTIIVRGSVQMFYRLWQHTSAAIHRADQQTATEEKFILEEAQRREARERKAKMEEWSSRYFERNSITGDWVYKYAE